jgi:hypothetical protein
MTTSIERLAEEYLSTCEWNFNIYGDRRAMSADEQANRPSSITGNIELAFISGYNANSREVEKWAKENEQLRSILHGAIEAIEVLAVKSTDRGAQTFAFYERDQIRTSLLRLTTFEAGAESAQAELDRARELIRDFVQWSFSHEHTHKDWACSECKPQSDMLVEGFKCAYHKAREFLSREGT